MHPCRILAGTEVTFYPNQDLVTHFLMLNSECCCYVRSR